MKLHHLTDKTLLYETLQLVQAEREILSKVLWHLREIDRRKLYSDLKCGSLFDYCVKVLKYSEGQASRRVTAARLLKDLPELNEKIETGAINLTQLNQAKHFFESENIKNAADKKAIIEKLEGKTTRESERLLNDLKQESTEKTYKIEVSETTYEALKEVQGLKGHTYRDLSSLLLAMTKEVRRVWVPQEMQRNSRGSSGTTRYISVEARAETWKRDKGKCVKCGSTYALEFDHVHPYSLGGKTTSDNLQLLCRNCNQRKSIASLGCIDFSRKKMKR